MIPPAPAIPDTRPASTLDIRSIAVRTVAAAERFDALAAERTASRSRQLQAEDLQAESDRRAGRGSAEGEHRASAVRSLRAIAAEG